MAGRKLQQELKKKHPFEWPEEEAWINIARTYDQLQIHFVRLFREHGITPSQYNILRILRGEAAPLPILEIASRLVTVTPGITGLIDRLEEAGFVQRVRCENDRRVIHVALLQKGAKTLAEVESPLFVLIGRLMRGCSHAELKQLSGLLEKVREPLSE